MQSDKISYFRCPYCGTEGGHEKRVSKRTGVFRIKQLYNNVFIMQCQICLKICRKMTVGATLLGADMSITEKNAFKNPQFKGQLTKTFNKYIEGGIKE